MGWAFVGVRVRGNASLRWDDACVRARFDPRKRGISEVKCNSVRQVRVESGGGGVVAHVGLHALGLFADRLGVGASLSSAVPPAGERAPAHDRGKVLTQAMLMLAGGGECVSDIEYLRAEGALFADVASAPTLYRTVRAVDAPTRDDLWAAMAGVRAGVWARRGVAAGSAPVTLDIDATLIEVHSENKQGTAAHYKGGFGFHPLLCFSDDGDALAALLRPGNAAANSIADHIELLDAATVVIPDYAARAVRGASTDLSKHQERSGRRRRRFLSPVQKYEAFVQVLTGEMTVAECADHWGVDRSTIMRAREVAKARRFGGVGVVAAGGARRSGVGDGPRRGGPPG